MVRSRFVRPAPCRAAAVLAAAALAAACQAQTVAPSPSSSPSSPAAPLPPTPTPVVTVIPAPPVVPVVVAGPSAQTLAPGFTLGQLMEELRTGNPQLRASRSTAQGAQFGVDPARALDNPQVAVSQGPIARNPFALGAAQGMQWTLSQSLLWPGKKRLAGEIAQAQADQARSDTGSLQVQLTGQLRSVWLQWQQAEAQIRVATAQAERLGQVKQITRLRYAQNAAAYADYVNAQVMETQIQTDLLGYRGQSAAALAQINSLIGRPVGNMVTPASEVLSADAVIPPVDGFRAAALDRNPTLKSSGYAIVAARRALELAELGARPDFSVGLTMNTARPYGFAHTETYAVAVSATVPLYFEQKEKNLIAQARVQLDAARETDDSLRQQAVLAVDTAWLQWKQSLAQLQLAQGALLDQARVAYRLNLGNYGTGQADYLDVVNSYQAVRNAEFSVLQARAAALQARVSLDVAVGDD